MAGLDSYLSMGLGIAALYIGVKYGPQVVQNLQAGSKAPAQATAPAQQPATPQEQQQVISDWKKGLIQPTSGHQLTQAQIKENQQRLAQNIAGTLPQAPPSGSITEKPSTRPSRARMHPKSATQEPGNIPNEHCTCTDGKQNGTACNVRGQPCATEKLTPEARHLIEVSKPPKGYEAYPGYYNSYNIPVMGPQWKQSVRYNEVVASQGSMQPRGRVVRALAATNHQFTPSGFVLSEASVRRGVNNVYSAGT